MCQGTSYESTHATIQGYYDREKITCSFVTGAQCYKTFFARNLLIFGISLSVCPWLAFPAYSSKRSSLVRQSKHQGQKVI
jgi:hypothetical protein